MYKTILLPHGGTAAGDEALKHAIHIAKQESSKITILNVIVPWTNVFDEYSEDKDTTKSQISSILSNMEDGVRKFLAQRVARCVQEGLQCQGIFRTGKPADAIIKYANENKIDLIIMAKKKKVDDYKSFFKVGGTAKKVQEKVGCSILLVDADN